MFPEIEGRENLQTIMSAVLRGWPEHRPYMRSGIAQYEGNDLSVLNELAGKILTLTDGALDRYAEHYRWMCDQFFREEVYFRRHKRYRLKKFEDALREVYGNESFMSKYMEGLMLSQVLWSNHARGAAFFVSEFLRSLDKPFDYLEIGPGHGLFAAYAARHPLCRGFTGWDVSPTSLEHCGASLKRLGVERQMRLECRDIIRSDGEPSSHDIVVISEVLEHLEDPARALATVRNSVRPGGKVFVNMPINSPAPDHIYLLRTPDAVSRLVEDAGLKVVATRDFPVTGYDLKTAMDRELTVTCIVVAERPEAGVAH